jgi:hypothetical protein
MNVFRRRIFQTKRATREKCLFSQLRCRHSLQVTKAVSHDLRFFLTKQLTFLRPSFLYTIYYSVLMNVFQKLNYTRILRYKVKAKNNFADSLRQTWRSKNSCVGCVVSAIFPGFTL